mmetsp:Transcript_39099/g.94528  ORF Transcript_39099/g.94528 Transcript_39099/m.94528 type:complete len:237 (+) Transcript_39099:188-898(+)
MYAIYHQIDREKRLQEEKENEQNVTIEELKQLEARYNLLLRRDSYSTITTRDTEIIIETMPDRKQLVPITWGKNGKLPIEISVPETRKDNKLLDDYDNNVEADDQAYIPSRERDDGLLILQNSLFVDDDEELALIFDDNHEDEMNVHRAMGNRAPLEASLASSSESSDPSVYTDTDTDTTSCDSEDLHEVRSSSSSSESSHQSSVYTDTDTYTTSCDSEDLQVVRFERERFTRFEV